MSNSETPSVIVSDTDSGFNHSPADDDISNIEKRRLFSDPNNDLVNASSRNPSILLELDMDGNVKHLSKSWEAIVGTKVQKIKNHPISNIVYGTEDDKKVFTDAISIMMTDDASYRVRFLTATNDVTQESSDEDEDLDIDDIKQIDDSMDLDIESPRESDDNTSLSSLSTNGGIIELEGQGILIHSQSGIPTRSMWILKPFYSNTINIQVPIKLAETLGFGIDIFASYLESLSDAGIINEEDVLPPPQVLCRICEQQVPSWWLEKHSELCLNEHKCESDVQLIHDSLIEQKENINVITESLNKQSYGLLEGVTDYKGLPLPKVAPQIDSTTNSPMTRGRSGSLFGTLRFPFKTLVLLTDLLDYAININPSEFQEELNTFEFSPNTSEALLHVSKTHIPESSDPAITLLSNDTEYLVDQKVESVLRMKNSLLYSQKIKAEVDELVLLSISETVKNIRNQTYELPKTASSDALTSINTLRETNQPGLKYPIPTSAQSNLFTDSYLHNDILPNKSASSLADILDSQGRVTPARSITPGETISREDLSQVNHPHNEVFRTFNEMNLKSPVLTPQRKLSPTISQNFHNSPMSSIQRNVRAHPGLESLSGTPISSPLIAAHDLNDFIEKRGSHSGENFLSVSSASKPPLSPLLVAMPGPKPVALSIKDYEILKPISKGAFGSVYLARRKVTGDYYAIKVLKKSDMIAKNQVTNVKAERAIMMAQSESPFVARLYSSFQSKDNLYLVMEYLPGGDCSTLVKMLGNLPDEWAKKYIAQVILGVEDLHKKGIIHHDLKPDNLLIDSSGHLKLTDFGLSRMGLIHRQERSYELNSSEDVFHQTRNDSLSGFTLSATSPSDSFSGPTSPSSLHFEPKDSGSIVQKVFRSDSNSSVPGSPMLKPLHRSASQTSFSMPNDEQLLSKNLVLFDPEDSNKNKKFVGTPDYLAPETIAGIGGDTKVSDWWSVGCILFEFLFGYPPFHDSTPEKIFQNILSGVIEWPDLSPEDELKYCSVEAKNLIKKLLIMDPSQRLGANGAQEIKEHAYFKGIDWNEVWLSEGAFVPVVDDPASTEYFEPRGASMHDVLIDDSESDPEVKVDKPNNSTTVLGSPSASNSPTQRHLSLAIPLHMRERRPSKLNENVGEFGSFQYRNLPALDKANKAAINRIKAEHLEHRNSISSSSSESGNLTRSRNYSISSPSSALQRSSSPSASFKRSESPHRGSFGSSNIIAQTPTNVNFEDSNSFYENSGRSTPSTDGGSPSAKFFIKPTTPISQQILFTQPQQPQPVFQLQSQPQTPVSRRNGSKGSRGSLLQRTFSEFSSGGSDTEDPKSIALQRVRKRRQSSKMSETSMAQAIPILDVLLCEPIPIVRYQLKKDLESLGCAVVTVSAGDELVRRATGEVKFDLILTALKSSRLDSVDIVKLLRHTNSLNSDTPIVAITAYYNEALSSGVFSEVLEKPVNRKQLQSALRKHCRWNSISNEEAVSDTEMLSDPGNK